MDLATLREIAVIQRNMVMVIDMLNIRGYDISKFAWILEHEYGSSAVYDPRVPAIVKLDLLIKDWKEKVRQFIMRFAFDPMPTAKKIWSAIKFSVFKKTGEEMLVAFINPTGGSAQIGSGHIDTEINKLVAAERAAALGDPTTKLSLFLVVNTRLTPDLENMIQTRKIELWKSDQLLMNPFRHVLGGMSYLVGKETLDPSGFHSTDVKTKHGVAFHNDSAVRWGGFQAGDIIKTICKVVIPNSEVEFYIDIRKVEYATGKEKVESRSKKVESEFES